MGTMNAARAMPILARCGPASPLHEESQRPTTMRLPYLLYCTRLANSLNCSQIKWAQNKTLAPKHLQQKLWVVPLQDNKTNTPWCLARSDDRPQWRTHQKSRTCRRQNQTGILHVAVITAVRWLRYFDGPFSYKRHQKKLNEPKGAKKKITNTSACG